jgi:hypothetical protein
MLMDPQNNLIVLLGLIVEIQVHIKYEDDVVTTWQQ